MKYWLSLLFEPPTSLVPLARHAEDLGFEGVFLPDHVVVKEGERTPHPSGYPLDATELFVDPFVAFSAMAAVTTRLRFLTFVYVVPLRDPFSLAKQAGSLAIMSGGRFVLGTGVGWLREEFDAMGPDFGSRGRRIDEMLTIMRDFWDDGFAEYHGEFFDFPRSGMFPVPEHHIPIWIGGHSAAAVERAARYDGYMPMRQFDDVARAELTEIDAIRRAEAAEGTYDRIFSVGALDDPGALGAMAAAGVTQALVMPWTQSDYATTLDEKRRIMERWAAKVLGNHTTG